MKSIGVQRLGSLTTCFQRETNFVSGFLKMLSIDACSKADFDSWTESLNVGNCSDSIVVDFTLKSNLMGRGVP
jgi:hypothetical protein